jgi:hypothetical protein
MIKKINKSKKNIKLQNKKTKTQKGGKTSMKKFTNIKYEDGKLIPKLKCNVCNGDIFNLRTMTMGSKTKAILDVEIFDNRFKVFTCVGCGNVTMFSNKIKCDGKNCDTSYF